MAFPLIPVLAGAAALAAVAYIVATRNPNAKKQLTNAAQDLGDSVQAGAEKLKDVVSDTIDDAGKAAEDAASSVKKTASKISS